MIFLTTYIENGKEVISIDDKQFEVIGVMGYGSDTVLDNMKVINIDSLMKGYNNDIYILDGYSKHGGIGIRKTVGKIIELLRDEDIEVEILDIKPIDADRVLGMNINTGLVFGLLIMCFLLCIYNISIAWIRHHMQMIGIMKLVGWTNNNIRHYIYIRLFLYSIIGVVLGLILSFILGIEIKDGIIIFYILLFNLILGFLSMVPVLSKAKKIPIAEVIK